MNKATKQIATYLGSTMEYAAKVQTQMMIDGLDFSECTRSEFNNAIVTADCKLLTTINPFDTIAKSDRS